MRKPIPTIYLDMDQVLFDLHTYCYENFYTGEESLAEVTENYKGVWGFETIFGMTHENWHADICWEEIPVLPWAYDLVKMVCEFRKEIEVGILSSPIYSEDCFGGKFAAVEEHFPELLQDHNFVLGKKKHKIVQHHDLLIDDSDWKCKKFAKAGKNKSFYLFPALSNCFYEDIYPLTQEKQIALLKKIAINIQAKIEGRL